MSWDLNVKKNRTPSPLPLLAVVAALISCLGGWVLLPSLQDNERTVTAQASQEVERARRILHQYRAALDHKSILLDQLRALDLDVDVDDVAQLLDSAEDEYQQHFDDAWERYRPVDWPAVGQDESPQAARAGRGSPASRIRDGVSGRERLLAENSRILNRALTAVNEALDIKVGDASSSSHAEATRLKGVILYHMGVRDRIHASQKRADAGAVRRDLAAVGNMAAARQSEQTLVSDSGIGARIEELQAAATDAEGLLTEDQGNVAAIEASVQSFEKRVADARSRSARARAALDRLQADGLDFSDPNAADTFAASVRKQDEIYRRGQREARALASGDYVSAEIDFSGDYLTGRYVDVDSGGEPAVRHGLAYHRHRLSVASLRLDLHKEALDGFRAGIARLQGMRDAALATQKRAIDAIAELKVESEELHSELNRIESEAFAFEESGLDLLEQSMRASRNAANQSRSWVDGTSGGSSSGPAADKRREAGWMAGYIRAQEADARLVRAWILADRFTAYTDTASVLEALPESVMPDEADAEQEKAKAADAHDAGVAEVSEAMAILERIHGDVGRHWTLTAQAAGTVYVLALLGHEDYAADAIEGYRLAVTGREDQPYAAAFVSRLKRLENR